MTIKITLRPFFRKQTFFLLWILLIVIAFHYFDKLGVPLSQYPGILKSFISSFGIIGPLVYILIYTVRPLIFFPATILTIASGTLFGPWYGVLYTVIGSNLSANASFLVGRYFGKNLMKKIAVSQKMVKLADCSFKENGFIAILTMRLIYMPFDIVSYVAGMCDIKQRDFALGTLIGILPGSISFVVLGASFTDPRNLITAGVFFVLGILISKYLKKRNTCNLNP